jgi:hypothetical protein
VWRGFADVPSSPYAWRLLLIGMFSTGTGIFGTLIFLDKRENTYTVPVNRASSILAGLVVGLFLHAAYDAPSVATPEWLGAGLILGAIVVLMLRPIVEARAKAAAAQREKATAA